MDTDSGTAVEKAAQLPETPPRGLDAAAYLNLQVEDLKPNELRFWEMNLDLIKMMPLVVSYEKGRGFEVATFEKQLGRPHRKESNPVFREIASFGSYVKNQAQSGENETRIYFRGATALAVIDDDGTKPGWRDHTASYEIPFEVEYLIWEQKNGTWNSEGKFAELIDAVFDSIQSPAPAELLDTVQSLHVDQQQSRSAESASDKREAKSTIRAELKTEIPSEVAVKLLVFEDFEVEFKVRIRTRVTDNLTVEFKPTIVDWFKLRQEVNDEICRRIKDASGIKPLIGKQ